MKKQWSTALLTMGVVVMLSGCSPVAPLTTPEARDSAVHDELDRIVSAIASHDAAELVSLQCKSTWIIEMPKAEMPKAEGTSADALRAEQVEPLLLEGSNYDEPDPNARFFLTSITGVEVDVVVRVDEQKACLWAMGPRFALLMGL